MEARPSVEPTWNLLSRLTFTWLDATVLRGRLRPLTESDLYELKDEYVAKNAADTLEDNLKCHDGDSNLITAIGKSFLVPFALAGIFKLIHDLLMFVGPLLIPEWIRYIEELQTTGDWTRVWYGFFLAAVLCGALMLQSFVLNQYFFVVQRTGIKVKTALSHAVYRKATRVSESIRQRSSTGKLINLLFNDSQKIERVFNFLHLVWSSPLQIIIALGLLVYQLGVAGIAGVGVMVLMIPINARVAKVMMAQRKKIIHVTDQRVKMVGEGLAGMRVIKFNGWEGKYEQRVRTQRKKELRWLLRIALVQAVTWFLMWSGPVLVTMTTFTVYAIIPGNELTTAKAFVGLNLLKAMQFSVTFLPNLMSMLAMAQVSIKRIGKFLALPEISTEISRHRDAEHAIAITGAPSFAFEAKGDGKHIDGLISEMDSRAPPTVFHRLLPKYRKKAQEKQKAKAQALGAAQDRTAEILHDINVRIPKGKITIVTGPVGCGKSSLLSAMLGEMRMQVNDGRRAELAINGKVALCTQTPWIANKTLRDNVLFGRPFDADLYRRVLWASCLVDDLPQFEAGDLVEIGEKGITLSGGQKQRVAVARALYGVTDRDIFLFDDPLAAVDAHVARHLFRRAIRTLLAGKTVVLVTHQTQYIPHCDHLIAMQAGRVTVDRPVADLRAEGALEEVVGTLVDEVHPAPTDSEEEEEAIMADSPSPSCSGSECPSPLSTDLDGSDVDAVNADEVHGGQLVKKETSSTGAVSIRVYLHYIAATGGLIGIGLTIIVYALSQAGLLGIDFALAWWTESPASLFWVMLAVYIAVSLGSVVLTLIRDVTMALLTLRASAVLHDKMLKSVVRAPMSFFETTPSGRILNRFSKDVDSLDSNLPSTWVGLWRMVSRAFILFITLCVLNWFFVVPLVPILIIYLIILQLYRASSREIKRLDSTTRSPIFAQFEETLSGLATIRAFRVTGEFITHNATALDRNNRAYYLYIVLTRWLSLRLEVLSAFIVFSVAVCGTLIAPLDIISAALFALSLTLSLNMTQMLAWLVRMTTQTESEMNAVERVVEYQKLPQEAALTGPSSKQLAADHWPTTGAISIRGLKARYRPELPVVVDIDELDIRDGMKVGIVGRTGSGKSTIFNVLFRIIEADAGSVITIDGRDIAALGLHDVRHGLAIIPQDPVLFNATLRYNLDPYDEYDDPAVWAALESVEMAGVIRVAGGVGSVDPLLQTVSEGGTNYSQGQRQLLCIARAILRDSRVICLDEATASVDLETDRLIQSMIRDQFKDKTVLTVAHRLNTIIDSDAVLVMEAGKVAEWGTPADLIRAGGVFADLIRESGQQAELLAVAPRGVS